MAGNAFVRVRAPDTYGDHELSSFKNDVTRAFDRGRGKAGAVIENVNVDRTYGDRVLALKIRGDMNPSQEQVLQKFAL